MLLAAERTKRLEVQGARNVAMTATKAVEEGSKKNPEQNGRVHGMERNSITKLRAYLHIILALPH